MRRDADRVGPLVTAGGDERVTCIGRFLRKTKLDELPELWNVVKGDLSIVGPRPEVPRYVAGYLTEWEAIFSVRPGITDLATLQFRNEESVLENARDHERAYAEIVIPIKMNLALEYVKRSSFFFDIRIILLTLWGITLGRFFGEPDRRLADEAKRRIVEEAI